MAASSRPSHVPAGAGGRAVANDIAVRLKLPRTDADLARDAAFALNLRASVPRTVKAIVHQGHVTLTGPVDWMFQKEPGREARSPHPGRRRRLQRHRGLTEGWRGDIRKRIVHALHRSADVNARQVDVNVEGDVATLTGTVGSWLQREAAERASGSAPGIRASTTASRSSRRSCSRICRRRTTSTRAASMITGYAGATPGCWSISTVGEAPINLIGESEAPGKCPGYPIWTRRKPPVHVGVNFDVHSVA